MSDDKPVAFYDCDDGPERLTHTTLDDAVLDFLDGCNKPLPKTVTVYRYARRYPTAREKEWWAAAALETLLESIDEEHGDPDGGTEADEPMKAAAAAFVDQVLATYTPWACEQLPETDDVDAVAWVAEHEPDWLTKDPDLFGPLPGAGA